MIFVFGSNLAGRHGKGAALTAKIEWGAEYGIGRGRTGDSYAIPTKDNQLRTRSLEDIAIDVKEFLEYASSNPNLEFFITRIGCGLAGYKDYQIAPMFKTASTNCKLPKEWLE